MNFEQLYILGSGGHGTVVAELALSSKKFQKIYFMDDTYHKAKLSYGLEVVGDLTKSSLKRINKKKSAAITAFGDGLLREKYHKILKNFNIPVITLIHKSSVVSSTSQIKSGTVIFAGAIVGPNTKIGEGVIINHNSSIDHDSKIGNFVHISPGVSIAGNVRIDELTHIGIGSSIIQGINIGRKCLIGAGSVVIKDICNEKKSVGVPAKNIN